MSKRFRRRLDFKTRGYVFATVNTINSGFQVIVAEHVDIDENWFQSAVVGIWRGGLKLIHEETNCGSPNEGATAVRFYNFIV